MKKKIVVLAITLMTAVPASATDKVTVAFGKSSNAMPYFVAVEQGFFEKKGIEINPVVISVNSMLQSSLIANQVDVSVGLLAVEGMTGNLAKPGSVTYIALNAQNATHRMEQFIARKDFAAKTIADFKGAKMVTAPGIGNVAIAKAALANAGLKEDDYTLDQLDVAQHINVLISGQYDGAFTLEPGGTMINEKGIGRTIMAGVIAKTILGDPEAAAYVSGTAVSEKFLAERREVVARFATAWGEAIAFIESNPAEARNSLLGNTPIAEDIVPKLPIIDFTMVSDLSDKDIANLQSYIDFAAKIGAIKSTIDVKPYLAAF
jgi:NitT/TauT family transport system substrate-binding protein